MSAHFAATLNSFAETWAAGMLRACWQGGLFVLAVWLACRVVRPIPPGVRCWLWWLACVKLLIALIWATHYSLPLLPSVAGTRDAAAPVIRPILDPGLAASFPASRSMDPHGLAAHPRVAENAQMLAAREMFGSSGAVGRIQRSERPGWTATALLGLWLAGLAAWLISAANSYLRMRRIRLGAELVSDSSIVTETGRVAAALGVRVSPRVFASQHIAGPVVVGIRKPVIVLPRAEIQALSSNQLRMVLAHEIAHLRRLDLVLGLVPAVVRGLFFFFPVAWLAFREYAVCRESACDAAAVQVTHQTAAEYGSLLLRYVAASSRRRLVGSLGAGSGLSMARRRIFMLQFIPSFAPRMARCWFAVVGMFVVAGLAPWHVVAAGRASEDVLAGNPVFDQKISVSAEGMPVGDMISMISARAGVTLHADKYTADEKVIVYAAAQPLRSVLRDIAVLLHSEWRRYTVGGKDQFELFRDVRARDSEDALANMLMDAVRAQLDAQVAALSETPNQLAGRPKDDPIRQRLSDPRKRLATVAYSRLSADQRTTLFERMALHLPLSALLPDQQESVRAQEIQDIAWLRRQKQEHPEMTFADIKQGDVDRQGLAFKVEQIFGEIHVSVERLGNVADYKAETQWLLPAHGDPYSGKPIPAGAPLPEARMVDESANTADWPDRLKKLAESTGCTVVSDYYRSKLVTRPYDEMLADGGTPPTIAALDRICHKQGYLWWVHGKTLLFRKRDWYKQRQYEVPDSWLTSLCERMKAQHGAPTYRDFFSLSALDRRQVLGLASLRFRQQPADTTSVNEIGENNLAGFFDALALAKDLYGDDKKPLQKKGLQPDDFRVVSPATITLDQRQLLQAINDEVAHPFDFDSANQLNVHLYTVGHGMRQGDATDSEDLIEVGFYLDTSPKSNAPFLFTPISLPIKVPDDRRDRTKITVIP